MIKRTILTLGCVLALCACTSGGGENVVATVPNTSHGPSGAGGDIGVGGGVTEPVVVMSEEELADRVSVELRDEGLYPRVQVAMNQNIAVLTGEVDSVEQWDLALETAMEVTGVESVDASQLYIR